MSDDLCPNCHERAIQADGLCRACYMRQWRKDKWQNRFATRGRRKTPGLDPWLRLEQAALRLHTAINSGWSGRAIESAEEQLKRAAEGYQRSRRNAGSTRGKPLASVGDGCPEAPGNQSERNAA